MQVGVAVMGKRSSFTRRRQDAYDTPASAVLPLVPFLRSNQSFCEPCAGTSALSVALEKKGPVGFSCAQEWDLEPRSRMIPQKDALDLAEADLNGADLIITNPPWTRSILHPMIEHFSAMKPTWLLFDADWVHTKQAAPYMAHLRKIVSVGRVSWMQNGVSGKDNCAWYLFDQTGQFTGQTQFFGRAKSGY